MKINLLSTFELCLLIIRLLNKNPKEAEKIKYIIQSRITSKELYENNYNTNFNIIINMSLNDQKNLYKDLDNMSDEEESDDDSGDGKYRVPRFHSPYVAFRIALLLI